MFSIILIYLLIQVIHGSQQRHLVLVLNNLGLANRLRAIASWYTVALLTHRELLVSYEPSPDCNSTFNLLFKEPYPQGLKVLNTALTDMNKNITISQVIEKFKINCYEQNLTFDVINPKINMYADGYNKFIVNRKFLMNDIDVLFTNHNGIIALSGVPCIQWFKLKSNFYKKLVPQDDILLNVNNIYNTYFQHKIMVGIHIRKHQNGYDWAVVPPGSEATFSKRYGDKALLLGEGAEPDKFIKNMKLMNDHFKSIYGLKQNILPRRIRSNNKIDINGDIIDTIEGESLTPIRYFITSNNPNIKILILNQFKDAVIIDHNQYNRNDPQAIKFALTEWLLLQKSSLIFHTYGSSFAEEAVMAQGGNVPLIGIWKGVNVLHNYLPLPYCGHSQFFEAYANQGYIGEYSENLHNNNNNNDNNDNNNIEIQRKVPGLSLLLMKCNQLIDWNISDLYCFQSDKIAKQEEEKYV